MKVTLLKETFEDRLNLSLRFVSNRLSAVQSIQGAKLVTGKDSLTIITTNLGDSFFTKISAKVEDMGTVVFDIKKALEFLNFLEPGEIELSLEDNQLQISQGKKHGNFNIYESNDFPDLPHLDGKEFPISQSLLDTLPHVLFSASKDETRPVMTGVYIVHTDDGAYFVTTDGFRLSLLQYPLSSEFPSTLIPASIFYEICKLSKRSDSIILTISPEDRLVKFTIGDIEIYSRIIEGTFPPYEKVVPKSATTTLELDVKELVKNIRLVAVFARDDADVVVFDMSKDGLFMRPKAARSKKSEVFQEVESFEGDDLKIAFNYKYVLEFLNTVPAEKVKIECTQPTAPAAFKMSENDAYLHIVMPLRTEETT